MAGIDRLYTRNVEDYIAFFAWMEKYAPELRDYTYTWLSEIPLDELVKWFSGEPRCIAYFERWEDLLLLWTCPLPFVREYLAKQCRMKTRWFHKIFWRGRREFGE